MMRHPRIEGRELVYFVSSNGRNGRKIFDNDQDKIYFINLLIKQMVKSHLIFYGYVLLPRLYAFILETHKKNLIQSMHRINSDYANYFNRRHRLQNKLFHDRYTCFIVEKGHYLAEASRYLHLLPLKKRAPHLLASYEWSSLPGYLHRDKQEDWISYRCILNMFRTKNLNPSLNYQRYIHEGIKGKIPSPFENLKGGIILGSEDFKKEVRQIKKTQASEIQKDEHTLAQKIIDLLNQNSNWPSIKYKKRRIARSLLLRNATIYFLKKFTDLSNAQISRYFNSLNASSISQMSRRFHLVKEKHRSLSKISDSLESKIKCIALKEKRDRGHDRINSLQ